ATVNPRVLLVSSAEMLPFSCNPYTKAAPTEVCSSYSNFFPAFLQKAGSILGTDKAFAPMDGHFFDRHVDFIITETFPPPEEDSLIRWKRRPFS
ncbi:MAG TPA: hypothetical protein PK777_14780, partial [Thermoguttaceae bacterium]|nr:hypothetical protein [Thermoguttaceae bacterium]